MISRIAIDAVTDPRNVSAFEDADDGMHYVDDEEVVAELRRLEGLGEEDARRAGREAVAHLGGHIERITRPGGISAGHLRPHRFEVWTLPRTAVRS